jgi:aryl-alcohol dehydrogenase-like predicted oxidoreductase
MGKRRLEKSSLEVSAIGFGVELLPADQRAIERATSEVAIQGARYPQQLQRVVGR